MNQSSLIVPCESARRREFRTSSASLCDVRDVCICGWAGCERRPSAVPVSGVVHERRASLAHAPQLASAPRTADTAECASRDATEL